MNLNYIKNSEIIFITHFKGAAHSISTLKYKVSKKIPVLVRNPGYDTHFIF